MKYIKHFLIIFSFAAVQLNGMHKAAQWFLTGSKAINHLVCLSLPLFDAYQTFPQMEHPYLLQLPDASTQLTAWVRAELKKSGITNPESIYIKVHDDPNLPEWGVSQIDTLICKKNEIDGLEELIAQGKYDDPRIIKTIGIIRHEAGHYIRQDGKNKKYIDVAAGMISHLGWQVTIEGIRKLATRNIGLCAQYPSIMAVTFGALHLKSLEWKWNTWQSNILQDWYSRYCERKADEHFFQHVQSKEELEGSIEFFHKKHQNILSVAVDENNSVYQDPQIKHRLNRVHALYKLTSKESFYNWLDAHPRCLNYLCYGSLTGHPTDKDRMIAAQKALEKFKEKNKNN